MSVNEAFSSLLSVHRRAVTISRPGAVAPNIYDIFVTPSNYFRSAEGPSEISVEGREFVIDAKALAAIPFSMRRGDVITDQELGECIVTEIREMYGFGGTIIGFRIRCG